MPIKFIFDDEKLGLWMLFHQTYSSIFKYEDKEFAKVGITPQQHAILMAIKNNNDSITPSILADWFERDANSITLIIDRMEKTGFVNRARDDNDHRMMKITMTKKGERALNKSAEVGNILISEMLENLSEKEIKTFQILLDKIREPAVAKNYPGKPIVDIRTGRSAVSKTIKKKK